ncbi:MAG: hypothetical protein IT366_06215 [Candidatus Hydrogenedentes bacterium]|nr:hypothetical protein [Candidatus Hydrogenedentota bacterium]
MSNATKYFANCAYQPLPGKTGRVLEEQRLFLAEDHLLVATRSINRETYKRFYLTDIQAITIQRTSDGVVANIFLGVLAGLFGVLVLSAVLNAWPVFVQIIFTVVAALFLGCTLLNSAFGPTCKCHILSAVHEEPLRCLGRLHTAQRVVNYLKAIIEGVQGTAGDLAGEGAIIAQRVDREAERRLLDASRRSEEGNWHLALFGFLILAAITGALGLFFRHVVPTGAYMIPAFIAMALALVAVIRQRDTDVPASLRTITWFALATNCAVAGLYLYAATIDQVAAQPVYAEDMKQMFGSIGVGFTFIANAVCAAANFILGPLGLYSIGLWRRANAIRREQQRIAPDEIAQP